MTFAEADRFYRLSPLCGRQARMRTRVMPPLAGMAAAVALLAGCGSGDPAGTNRIEGAITSPEAPPPSPATTADAIPRPKIKLPRDVRNVFEGRRTGNETKNAVLADSERRINAVDAALTAGNVKHPALTFYATDRALTGLHEYVRSNVHRNVSWQGTARYFDRRVTVFGRTSAAVTYCVDESRANLKNRKTNKVTRTKTSSDSYVYYNAAMKKNKDGVWQTRDLSEDRGAQRCQP
ncbi:MULTISPECIES: hypothetical protein [Streptomyces]